MDDLNIKHLSDIVVKGNVDAAKSFVAKLLGAGIVPERIIEEGLLPGLSIVGERYECGEFYLPELFSAGEVAKATVELLQSRVELSGMKRKGTIVIGTVHGDVHDIGMNLISATWQGAGYQVFNIGKNVQAKDFVNAVSRHNAHVLAMSALLTTTMVSMKTVIDSMKEAGLRDRVKIIVGGAPLDDEFAEKIGADAYGKDAGDGLRKIKELIK